jgi:hypothetical protein
MPIHSIAPATARLSSWSDVPVPAVYGPSADENPFA